MTRKLKIFFYMFDAVGPQNACVGLGQVLLRRGHQVYFLTKTDVRASGRFSEYGFTTLQLKQGDGEAAELSPEEAIAEQKRETAEFLKVGAFDNIPPAEKLKKIMSGFFTDEYLAMFEGYERQIRQYLEQLQPDLLVIDSIGLTPPCLLRSPVPWVFIYCSNPLGAYHHPDLPPATSGLPIDGPREAWEEFRAVYEEHHDGVIARAQHRLLQKCGYEVPAEPKLELLSPYLNIYQFPEELDYDDVVTLPKNFLRVDAFCRTELGAPFEVPAVLKSQMKPGDKLIYFSLGSIGTTNVPLMKRIIGILARTPHFYIVSKGVFHDEIGDLPPRMWGDRYVPQTKILPIVDMAIIHGGNNSLTEAIHFGTPIVVMPIFYDQFDNGQRVLEKGFGLRVNPYDFEDEQLMEAIETVLGDAQLKAKLARASERIRASQSKEHACDAMEKVALQFAPK